MPDDTTGLTDEEWEEVHRRCGHDLIGLLMDFKHDRATATETADRIIRRCSVVADIVRRKEALNRQSPASEQPTK